MNLRKQKVSQSIPHNTAARYFEGGGKTLAAKNKEGKTTETHKTI